MTLSFGDHKVGTTLNLSQFPNMLLSLKGELEQALIAFLMTSCIHPSDSEAWRNSLNLALAVKHFGILPIIYGAAHKSVGSEFVNYFAQSILDHPTLTMDVKQELISAFADIAKS